MSKVSAGLLLQQQPGAFLAGIDGSLCPAIICFAIRKGDDRHMKPSTLIAINLARAGGGFNSELSPLRLVTELMLLMQEHANQIIRMFPNCIRVSILQTIYCQHTFVKRRGGFSEQSA